MTRKTGTVYIEGYHIPINVTLYENGYCLCSLNSIIAVGAIAPTEEQAIKSTKNMFLRIRQIGMKKFLNQYGIELINR